MTHRRLVLLLPAVLAATLASSGCAVTLPIGPLPPAGDAVALEVVDLDYAPPRRAPTNRYALLMSGRVFEPPRDGRLVATPDDLQRGRPLEDPWVAGDVAQLERLLLAKGYDVYRLDLGQVGVETALALLGRLAAVSDAETRTFLAYSGEGDARGLRTRAMRIAPGRLVLPAASTLEPAALFDALARLAGSKAVLINACESGVFAEAAAARGDLDGVVIAACPRGTTTTPHEPAGTTAIVAAFLELYASDPARVLDLSRVDLPRAGGFWTNLLHHLQHWRAERPLSYDPVIYRGGRFWL